MAGRGKGPRACGSGDGKCSSPWVSFPAVRSGGPAKCSRLWLGRLPRWTAGRSIPRQEPSRVCRPTRQTSEGGTRWKKTQPGQGREPGAWRLAGGVPRPRCPLAAFSPQAPLTLRLEVAFVLGSPLRSAMQTLQAPGLRRSPRGWGSGGPGPLTWRVVWIRLPKDLAVA